MLLGYAMERLLSSPRFAPVPTHDAVRLEAKVPTQIHAPEPAPVAAPAPEPALVKADSVVSPASQKRHVVVLGILPDAISLLQEKAAVFGNVSALFVDSRDVKPVPSSVPCDYLLMTKETITKFQAEQLRRRLGATGEKRIIHIDGTMAEVLKHLSVINSLQ